MSLVSGRGGSVVAVTGSPSRWPASFRPLVVGHGTRGKWAPAPGVGGVADALLRPLPAGRRVAGDRLLSPGPPSGHPAPSSSGLGHHPLKVETRVRTPLGLLIRAQVRG